MKHSPSVVILVSRSHIGSLICVNSLLNSGLNIKAIVKSRNFLNESKLRSIIKLFKVMGLRLLSKWFFVIAYMKLRIILATILDFLGKKKRLMAYSQIQRKYGIPIIKTKNINSHETIKKIDSLKPDLILSCYFNQILKKEIINIPRYGCLNIHPAIIQKYRGLSGYFWVLANNDESTGVTIHYMDNGIDTGDIVAQKRIIIGKKDTEFGLLIKLSREGAKLFLNIINSPGKMKGKKNNISNSVYCSIPAKEAYKKFLKLNKKIFTFSDFRELF